MLRTRRIARWMFGIAGAGFLLQVGACNLTNTQEGQLFYEQLVLPQLTNIVTDTLFFVLDNALVRLTT